MDRAFCMHARSRCISDLHMAIRIYACRHLGQRRPALRNSRICRNKILREVHLFYSPQEEKGGGKEDRSLPLPGGRRDLKWGPWTEPFAGSRVHGKDLLPCSAALSRRASGKSRIGHNAISKTRRLIYGHEEIPGPL